jgi:AraC-like DNA-binding protein
MTWRRPDTPIPTPLGRTLPPYRGVEPFAGAAPGARLVPGTLLVLDLDSPAPDWPALTRTVLDVRTRHPAAPVILRVSQLTPAAVRLAQRAARMGVRGVVGADEPLYDALRPLLTAPDDLGSDVVEWMRLRGMVLPPAVGELLRQIVGLAWEYPHLTDLLDTLAESERTARHRFGRAGLRPPRAWHRAARALYWALRIQAEPETPLLPLALAAGYSDHSGLCRQLVRTFGYTPGFVRGTLGWEWLLARWMAHAARTRPVAV